MTPYTKKQNTCCTEYVFSTKYSRVYIRIEYMMVLTKFHHLY